MDKSPGRSRGGEGGKRSTEIEKQAAKPKKQQPKHTYRVWGTRAEMQKLCPLFVSQAAGTGISRAGNGNSPKPDFIKSNKEGEKVLNII